MADLPASVMKQIGDYQKNVDYEFKGAPMPYDITVTFDDTKSPMEKYKVIASPKREEVSENTMTQLGEKMAKMTPEQNVFNKKQKQIEEHKKVGLFVNVDEVELARKAQYRKEAAELNASTPTEKKVHVPTMEEEGINADDIKF